MIGFTCNEHTLVTNNAVIHCVKEEADSNMFVSHLEELSSLFLFAPTEFHVEIDIKIELVINYYA